MDKLIYSEILNFLLKRKYPDLATNERKTQIRLQSNKYLTLHNTLYRIPKTGKPCRVLTTDDTDLILFAFHKDSFGAH